MKEKNITALVSSFVRYYHHKNSNIKVYDDKNCDKVLTFEEYLNIKENMVDGIKYFNPSFKGTEDDAILWIVNNQIGPSVLGRSAFNKKMLKNAIKLGCGQYLVYASGYDTSSLDYNIKCFEIDKKNNDLTFVTIKSEDVKKIEKDLNINVNYVDKTTIKFKNQMLPDELMKKLLKYKIDKLLIEEASLEDIFLHYYK